VFVLRSAAEFVVTRSIVTAAFVVTQQCNCSVSVAMSFDVSTKKPLTLLSEALAKLLLIDGKGLDLNLRCCC
jgi:hypothetical protein